MPAPSVKRLRFVPDLPRDNDLRREFGAGPKDVLVLYAGNIGEKQDLDLVLDAAERLRGHEEIKFAMVGAGAARKRLKRIVEERGLGEKLTFEYLPVFEDDVRLRVPSIEKARSIIGWQPTVSVDEALEFCLGHLSSKV